MKYDYYGVYSSCRDAAWQCQLDFGICSLPVKLTPLARQAGFKIHRNSDVHELQGNELGASIFINGTWHIVYDDRLPNEEARMILAHEFGHILLRHKYKYATHRFADDDKKLKSEKEADMFAIRLLAPACILHELGTLDALSIAKICEIPYKVAEKRAKRLNDLEKRGSFYKSEIECQVLENFRSYLFKCRKAPLLQREIDLNY